MVLRLLLSVLVFSTCVVSASLVFERLSWPLPTRARGYLGVDTLGTSGDGVGEDQIVNHRDLRYSTNVTLGGKSFVVALDTGSTDLWVHPATLDSGWTINDTNIPLQLRYGDGSYGVNGSIAVASFAMGSFNIAEQAFLRVESTTVLGLREMGIDGVLGLSFDFNTASPINQAARARDGPDASWGSSVLKNIFDQDPDTPNFIALDLARTDDLEDVAGGSFSIGTYPTEEWATGIAQAPRLAQFPRGGSRWTTLLDGVLVDGTPLQGLGSSIRGAPNGSLVVLLDSGDPTASVPVRLQREIYSRVPGAVSFERRGEVVWVLPCDAKTVVEFVFGGKSFPLHPLDLSVLSTVTVSGTQYTACVKSIFGVDDLGGIEFDASLGDIFLRNVYTVFDFGDESADGTSGGEPFVQFLAQTNVSTAVAQVGSIRNRTMAMRPREIAPVELLQLLQDADPSIITTSPRESANCVPASGQPGPLRLLGRSDLLVEEGLPRGSVSETYNRVIVGLLAANLVVGLAILAIGVFTHARRKGNVSTPRGPARKGTQYVMVSHGMKGNSLLERDRVHEELQGTPSDRSVMINV